MAVEVVSRPDALAQGRKRYFTGVPCKHGHISERISSSAACLECNKRHKKVERLKNPEKFRLADKNRPSSQFSRERHKEASRRWRAENPEKCREAYRRRYAEKSSSWCAYRHNRRALKLRVGGSFTAQQIENLFRKQRGKCAGCLCSIARGWHNDHIVSLSKGGSNDISNIQLLCRPCNRQKYTKDPIVWAQENGRLL